MDEVLRVPMDDLETSEEDVFFNAVYQGKPFTGVAYDQWADGYAETAYVDGAAHGRSFERFADGQMALDEVLDHGHVVEGTGWWPPGKIVRWRKTPEAERWYYRSGVLCKEKTAEHLRTFYPSGPLREETMYQPEAAVFTYYALDGTWAAKGRFSYVFQQTYTLEREKMTFNDAYILSHAAALLAEEPVMSFWPYFVLWLPKREKKGLFRRSPETPPAVRQVICDLIRSENLHVKYHGVNLANTYQVTEAIPLLREALNVKVNPGYYGPPEKGPSAGYACTVAQRARIALGALEK